MSSNESESDNQIDSNLHDASPPTLIQNDGELDRIQVLENNSAPPMIYPSNISTSVEVHSVHTCPSDLNNNNVEQPQQEPCAYCLHSSQRYSIRSAISSTEDHRYARYFSDISHTSEVNNSLPLTMSENSFSLHGGASIQNNSSQLSNASLPGETPNMNDTNVNRFQRMQRYVMSTRNLADFDIAQSHLFPNRLRLTNDSDEDIFCAICLDGIELGSSVIKLPCKHMFHELCITRWFRLRYICPLCRSRCSYIW
uniref:RING-type domain-containing protein n=1 Tax=Glossina brevipalpis TaxID=37001 RepID=A0A1A9WIM0_9MUSC